MHNKSDIITLIVNKINLFIFKILFLVNKDVYSTIVKLIISLYIYIYIY